jgi:hypothetical protein
MQRSPSDLMSFSGIKDVLQRLGAGLFIVFSLVASFVLLSRYFADALPVWIVGPLLVAGFLVFVYLGTAAFRGKGSRDRPDR